MSRTKPAPGYQDDAKTRADACRAKAAEAEAFAANTGFAEIRANYLKTARNWRLLAEEAEGRCANALPRTGIMPS